MVKTIGVIGLGSIGMRHKNNLWQKLGQTEVVGYDPATPTDGKGWIIGDRLSFIEMCDAIIVASPTPQHWTDICDATMAGKKIFAEKPVANKDPHAIPENVLMVGYNNRFHECVVCAKAWIDSGKLGQPLWANFTLAQYNAKSAYLRDGVILNWSHEIDLALHLLGPAKLVGSNTTLMQDLTDDNKKHDVACDILLAHDNFCQSTIHLDYLTQPEIRQTIIVGSDNTIIIDLVSGHAWLRDKDGIIRDQHAVKNGFDLSYVTEMKAFLRTLDGKENTIGCTGQQALDVLRICLEVRKQAGL